jgi:hypothetical protein
MTPREMNAKLARWARLRMDAAGNYYTSADETYTDDLRAIYYFDAYHRIDHAWILVERARVQGWHVNLDTYRDTWIVAMSRLAMLRTTVIVKTHREATQAICEAILDIQEQTT